MKPKPQQKNKKAAEDLTPRHWREMNRKQRRETMRKMESQDLSLEVVHPDAAGIDIGNEFHYVAVPPSRDGQPVRRFGCTTAELKAHGRLAEAVRDLDYRDAVHRGLLDCGIRYSRTSGFGGVLGERPGHEESTRAQKRRAGESMADEARAEQRAVPEGSSPSGARMRGAISESGDKTSLAGAGGRYGEV